MLVELHILQNVAPSCLNRDDANAPKDCEFGGSRRARISSQCIKRSIRQEFIQDARLTCGIRTKEILQKMINQFGELNIQGFIDKEALAIKVVSQFFSEFEKEETHKTKVLIFSDDEEIKRLAEYIRDTLDKKSESEIVKLLSNDKPKDEESGNIGAGKKGKKKDNSKLWKEIKKGFNVKTQSVDLALFGRMLAENPGGNIDGACQVAHAISTNRVQMEFDFFTAVDDLQPQGQQGAGMMGTVGFNSSCFYRYAVINTTGLLNNLAGNAAETKLAIESFLKASLSAMPTGKQNSFAAHNPPSFALAVVRQSNMPWSLANAFERPVRPGAKLGLVDSSVAALQQYWHSLSGVYQQQLGLQGGSLLLVDTPENDNLLEGDFAGWRQKDAVGFVQAVISQTGL